MEEKGVTENKELSQQLRCERYLSLLGVNLIGFNCAAINPPLEAGCQSVCDKLINADRADYADLMMLNGSQVLNLCSGSVDMACEIDIEINYNFRDHTWEDSNGDQLDSLMWRSHEYPLLRDLITVCGFSSLVDYHGYNLRYCAQSSPSFDYNRSDFINSQFLDVAQQQSAFGRRFYFCLGDQIDTSNLKVGTLSEALISCDDMILTPDLCHNSTQANALIEVVQEARQRGHFNLDREIRPVSQMWTGMRRFNATHFTADGASLLTSNDLVKWLN